MPKVLAGQARRSGGFCAGMVLTSPYGAAGCLKPGGWAELQLGQQCLVRQGCVARERLVRRVFASVMPKKEEQGGDPALPADVPACLASKKDVPRGRALFFSGLEPLEQKENGCCGQRNAQIRQHVPAFLHFKV